MRQTVSAFDSIPAAASRRELVRRTASVGIALVAGGALARGGSSRALAAPSPAQDRAILDFALLLEYVQAAFYGRAVEAGRLRGELREFAETVADHERQHVRFLRTALGPHARTEPTYRFGEATRDPRRFVAAAVGLENLGVAAYNGQVANLTKETMAAAAEIVSVEGRHAAWISDLGGRDPAPRAADPGASSAQVLAALRATGLVRLR